MCNPLLRDVLPMNREEAYLPKAKSEPGKA